MIRRLILTVFVAGMVVVLAVPSAYAGATIVQPGQTYAGKSYGQWSAAWWRWAASISRPNSPVDEPTGKNCAVQQRGPVWFLAGTPGTSSPRCTVPADKAILFPVINGECSSVEGNGTTDAELRKCAQDQMDLVTTLGASVDGVPVDLGPNGSRFRFQSPLFQITWAPNNGFNVPAGTGASVADGFWVLLKPLATGRHEIDFHGAIPAFNFQLDVHYLVTVTEQQ
jgi:hypothetical protein